MIRPERGPGTAARVVPRISGGSTASSGPIRDAIPGRLEGILPEIRPGLRQLVLPAACTCFVLWRVFWTTMIGRSAPRADPHLAVTDQEIALLDRLVPDLPAGERSLFAYVVKLARLGGYLARSRDPPPGNLVMWRGFARLADIALGAALAQTSPGCG